MNVNVFFENGFTKNAQNLNSGMVLQIGRTTTSTRCHTVTVPIIVLQLLDVNKDS